MDELTRKKLAEEWSRYRPAYVAAQHKAVRAQLDAVERALTDEDCPLLGVVIIGLDAKGRVHQFIGGQLAPYDVLGSLSMLQTELAQLYVRRGEGTLLDDEENPFAYGDPLRIDEEGRAWIGDEEFELPQHEEGEG